MIPATRQEIKETPFAERRCQNYAQLIQAFDERRRELRFSTLEFDARAGWADGYSSKLICLTRNMGKLSFGLMLDALGLEIVVRSRCQGEEIAHAS